MHPRTPLWISFTFILLTLVHPNDADKQDHAEGGNLPPHILELQKKLMSKSYSFPIVSKDGIQYYDLSSAGESEVIYANAQSVKGITATRPGCKLQNLRVGVPYRLDEDLLNNCPQLSLKLEGSQWECVREGLLLVRSGAKVDISNASCTDAWLYQLAETTNKDEYQRLTMEKGVDMFMDFGITNCSVEMCECKWYFNNNTYFVTVNCFEVGLTDDTLPILPTNVINIRMKKNNLKSMDNLVKHLLPYSDTLTVINLDDNMLDSFPTFPDGSFPNLISLSLVRNKMKKIDIEAFKKLITRKELLIHFEENIFPCDCTLFKFKVFLEHSYVGHWSAFYSFMKTRCKTQEENKTLLVYKVSKDTCNNWTYVAEINWLSVIIFILSTLNLIMFYLMADLVVIIKFKSHRRPTMDHVVCGVKSIFCWPFRREENVNSPPSLPGSSSW